MGVLISRFRKKPTITEQLQNIEENLVKIEDYKRHTERLQKRTVASLLIYGAALYILACGIVFVWYLPESWLVRLALIIPLLLFPFILYGMKRLLSKFFHNKMVRANEDYAELQRKKKNIIDSVMDTETFNKAREILVKYAPERLEKKLQESDLKTALVVAKPNTTDLRKRSNLELATTNTLKSVPKSSADLKLELIKPTNQHENPDFKLLTLPLPVLKKERTFSERLVDYLIGEGPEFRYALICIHCSGHNGMALKEEFLYITFKCCYCRKLNLARCKRPAGPRLQAAELLPESTTTSKQLNPQIRETEVSNTNTSDGCTVPALEYLQAIESETDIQGVKKEESTNKKDIASEEHIVKEEEISEAFQALEEDTDLEKTEDKQTAEQVAQKQSGKPVANHPAQVEQLEDNTDNKSI